MPCIVMILLLIGLFSCHFSGRRPATLRRVGAVRHVTVGAAAAFRHLADPEYARILGSEFAQLEPENEMKFARVHPERDVYDFAGSDALVAFAETHHMLVRGHTLVWHRQLPQWVAATNFSSSQLNTILREHITTVIKHYAGRVYAWDVVNEAFNDDASIRSTIWYDQPGTGYAGNGTRYIEQALMWAHAADPNAKLFYNDYGAEGINAKSNAIFAMSQDFKARGVPLDGIGFQAHLTLTFDNPATLASLAANLQRFANLGLDLHITELDIRLRDSSPASLQAQAKLYGEITRICVQQPACKVLQTWGFTDKYSWIPQAYPGMDSALLWDAEYRKKPAYFGLLAGLRQSSREAGDRRGPPTLNH